LYYKVLVKIINSYNIKCHLEKILKNRLIIEQTNENQRSNDERSLIWAKFFALCFFIVLCGPIAINATERLKILMEKSVPKAQPNGMAV
jgi:hypothetical protein